MTIAQVYSRTALVGAILLCWCASTSASAQESGFRDVLTTAGIEPQTLASLASHAEFTVEDWKTLAQVLYRLRQFPASQLRNWEVSVATQPGDLTELSGTVMAVEPIKSPEASDDLTTLSTLHRCKLTSEGRSPLAVLVPKVPLAWHDRQIAAEPVRLTGMLLGTNGAGEELYLANHLGWYPHADVPTGWSLLASAGTDVALLDEVRHRQPFVKPDVSREGEAFYQCLAAMAKLDKKELAKLTLAEITTQVDKYADLQLEAQSYIASLRHELAATQVPAQRGLLQQQLTAARREAAVAEAVVRQGRDKLSSVAPMFLEPEAEIGNLVRIEGLARRAVRIAVPADAEAPPGLDAYYEMEVFTPDSQNLPVVCCVASLPEDFPTGDSIHEAVRLDGVFFKCWRYRTRKNLATSGQTDHAAQLYTPVVVGGEPRVVKVTTNADSRWGMWGGIGFLAVLAAIWVATLCAAAQERQRRTARAPRQLEYPPEGP